MSDVFDKCNFVSFYCKRLKFGICTVYLISSNFDFFIINEKILNFNKKYLLKNENI